MQRNLDWFDRLVRFSFGVVLLLSALYLFHQPLARLAVAVFGIYALAEGLLGICPLFNKLGKGKLSVEAHYLVGLLAIQCVIAYEWWSAGFEKMSSGVFVTGLPKTLGFFASQNPFMWVKNFLLGFATNNATIFGQLVQWSQIVIAVVLVLSAVAYVYSKNTSVRKTAIVLSVLALIGGMVMNIIFYLAAGWTGPGTKGVNVMMFWTEAILAYTWLRFRLVR